MIPWATLWGSCSQGHMKADRWRAASATAASIGSPAATRARTRSKARASGWTVAGWTAWIRGSATASPRRTACPHARDDRGEQGSAADLDHDAVQARGPAR